VPLTAQVDTGSTHTFITEAMVSKMQLPLERRQGIVKVANGDKDYVHGYQFK
jgi:predicted aspartyl protease